jgi:hypothetical protein
MGVISGAGTAYPSGAPEFTPGFWNTDNTWIIIGQYFTNCIFFVHIDNSRWPPEKNIKEAMENLITV